MNLIVLESQRVLDSLSLKTFKDKINIQLEEFLNGLSLKEIEQFKFSKDYAQLAKSIKEMNIENPEFNNFKEIKNIDNHIIESMIKRFFDNA